MDWNKLHKFVETINTYYAFAVLLYVAILYVASHSQLFWWILLALTPLIAGWTGFIFKSYLLLRNTRHGFKLLSDVMTYEVKGMHRYTLRYKTTLKAVNNHILSYPLGYQWTGEGEESIPIIKTPNYQLGGIIRQKPDGSVTVEPYKEVISSQGEWHYWFIGLNPAAYKNDIVELNYEQDFYDRKKKAESCLFYPIKHPMNKLELNVKFSMEALPKKVSCSYIKLSDPRRIRHGKGMQYDPDKQWATWVIDNPKKGYCYRIDWQE